MRCVDQVLTAVAHRAVGLVALGKHATRSQTVALTHRAACMVSAHVSGCCVCVEGFPLCEEE